MKQTATPAFQPRQLAGYLSGAVGMATVLAAPHAQAAVIYWNPTDTTATTAGGNGFRFDMLDGSVTAAANYNDTTASGFVFWNGPSADYTFITRTTSLGNHAVGSGAQMSNLTGGTTIDVSNTFGAGAGTWAYFDQFDNGANPWNTGLDGTTGFVGLRFQIAGSTHYGWAQFTYDDATTGDLTLHDFAYEDVPELGIKAGSTESIPEPGSALLALAGLGGMALRRRRKAA